MEKERIFLTKEGHKRLLNKRKKLEEALREVKKTTVPLARASSGNLWHDNAAFEQAEREIDKLSSLLSEVREQLATATIIKPKTLGKDKIYIGSKIKVRVDGEEHTYLISGWGEADPGRGKISYASPFGKAVLGAKVGDLINMRAPKRKTSIKIIKIFSSNANNLVTGH